MAETSARLEAKRQGPIQALAGARRFPPGDHLGSLPEVWQAQLRVRPR